MVDIDSICGFGAKMRNEVQKSANYRWRVDEVAVIRSRSGAGLRRKIPPLKKLQIIICDIFGEVVIKRVSEAKQYRQGQTQKNTCLQALSLERMVLMNTTINFATVSAKLAMLNATELESVNTFIDTLVSLRSVVSTVSAPVVVDPTPVADPAPVVADAPKSDAPKASIKSRKSASTKVAEPSTLTTSSVSAQLVFDYHGYAISKRIPQSEYQALGTKVGGMRKDGKATAAPFRGLISAVADGKVSVADAKKAIAQFRDADLWKSYKEQFADK